MDYVYAKLAINNVKSNNVFIALHFSTHKTVGLLHFSTHVYGETLHFLTHNIIAKLHFSTHTTK